MKFKKSLIATLLVLIAGIFTYYFLMKQTIELSCSANANLFYYNQFSSAPTINAVIYMKLNHDGYGIEELVGTIEWKGEVYPLSKLIKVKHDFKGGSEGLLTLHVTSIVSRAYDKSPPGLVEQYFVGGPDLPELVLRYKKIFENGYAIGNVNSPVLVCIDR